MLITERYEPECMSLRHNSGRREVDFPGRAVLQNGEDGAAIGIPALVQNELDVEAGKDGDAVDLTYNRDEGSLKIHFDVPPARLEQLADVLESDEVDDLEELRAVLASE